MDYGPDNPFLQIDKILSQMQETKLILLDFHAEATSEKLAMGYLLDGRVTAVWGTHTHVPTADVQILPQGTGYITDLGMTGPKQSVIGIRPELSIEKFRGGLYSRYQAADGPCCLSGAVFTVDTGHRAVCGCPAVYGIRRSYGDFNAGSAAGGSGVFDFEAANRTEKDPGVGAAACRVPGEAGPGSHQSADQRAAGATGGASSAAGGKLLQHRPEVRW